MKQKGFAPIIIILVIAILGVVGYLGYRNFSKSTVIIDIPNEPVELKGVPIYPNSVFNPKYDKEDFYSTGREDGGYCGKQILCKSTSYTFTITDSTDAVFSWYKALKFDGWKFVPTTDVVDQGKYGKEYYGSELSNSQLKYFVNIQASYQGGFQGNHSLVLVKAGPPYEWPSASQNEISNWKVFASADGLFTFKYPKEWINENGTLYLEPNCEHCGGVRSYFSVKESDNPSNLSSQVYVDANNGTGKYDWQGKTIQGVIVKNKPPYLNNIDVTIVDGLSGAGSPGPDIYLAKGGKIIVFKTDGVGVELLNKVLSTLKFTQ